MQIAPKDRLIVALDLPAALLLDDHGLVAVAAVAIPHVDVAVAIVITIAVP